MPSIKSSTLECCTLLTASISLNREIISPCFYYIKKGLVYIVLTAFFSCQPASCFKYIKVNICSSYNIYLVSVNKYTLIIF